MKKLHLITIILLGIGLSKSFGQSKSLGKVAERKFQTGTSLEKSATGIDTIGTLWGADSLALYTSPSGGYVSGVNGFYDREKAQVFTNDSVFGVTEVLFLFGGKTYSGDTSSRLWVNFYKTNGQGKTINGNEEDGAPGDLIAQIPYTFSMVDTSGLASLPLTWPITLDSEFAISISFWDLKPGDTIALFTGYSGQADSSEMAWEKLNTGSWSTMLRSWPLDADFAIFPVIDYQYTGILENSGNSSMLAFPNPCTEFIRVRPFKKGKNGLAFLVNQEGKMVMKQFFNPMEESYQMETSSLPDGNYLLYSSVDGLTQKAKVLVSHP